MVLLLKGFIRYITQKKSLAPGKSMGRQAMCYIATTKTNGLPDYFRIIIMEIIETAIIIAMLTTVLACGKFVKIIVERVFAILLFIRLRIPLNFKSCLASCKDGGKCREKFLSEKFLGNFFYAVQ